MSSLDDRSEGVGRGWLAALSLMVGALSACLAAVLRWAITGATYVFGGQDDTGVTGRENPWIPALGSWYLLLAPALGGLLYGWLRQRIAPEVSGLGVSEVIDAVAERGGQLPIRVAAMRAMTSALCIGSGGSVGREGPAVHLCATMGAAVGRLAPLPRSGWRILVTCGVAAATSVMFDAALVGAVFAVEVVLCELAVDAVGAVLLSSAAATIVGRALPGHFGPLALTQVGFPRLIDWPPLLFAGVLAGVCAVTFVRVRYLVLDVGERVWRGPRSLRPAAGGLLLGGLLMPLPQLYGVGYPALRNAIGGHYAVWFLLILLAGKMLATSLTLGMGGSGGVFGPVLFIGATGGAALGLLAHQWWPALTATPAQYGLLGMAAAVAAAMRAPLTAIVLGVTLSGRLEMALPLVAVVALASATGRTLSRDSLYVRTPGHRLER